MIDDFFPCTEYEAKKAGIEFNADRIVKNKNAEFPSRMKALRFRRSQRVGRKITQTEAAEAMGITRSALGFYETGDTVPDVKIIRTIADYYDTTVNYLLGVDERPDFEDNYIAEQTGLSDKAIKTLNHLHEASKKGDAGGHTIKILNHLLVSGDGILLFEYIYEFLLGHFYYSNGYLKMICDKLDDKSKDEIEISKKLLMMDIEMTLFKLKEENN